MNSDVATGTIPPVDGVKVGMREFRARMGDYMRRVARGEAITLLSRGQAIAVVQPPAPTSRLPQPGFLIGTGWEEYQLPEWTDDQVEEFFYKPIE